MTLLSTITKIDTAVLNFAVDSKRSWTPCYNMVVKKPSDHCAIQIKIMIPCIITNSKKKPVIIFRNPEVWQK